jgi:hypothetical protein
MIQFMRKTGPKNHTHEAIRYTTHTHDKHTRLAESPAKRRTIGTKGIETASQLEQQLEANSNSRMARINVQPA